VEDVGGSSQRNQGVFTRAALLNLDYERTDVGA
jgi:hypothetical protein